MQFFPSLNSNHLRSAHLGVGRLFRGREEAVLHGQVARTLEAKVAFINDRLRQSPQSLSHAQENLRVLKEKISNPEPLFLRPTCSTSVCQRQPCTHLGNTSDFLAKKVICYEPCIHCHMD